MRRLLMVGIAEAAAGKTLVRSHHGIRGAFVVERASEGKRIVEVQLEGSCFETVWQLKEGGDGGILDLNKVGDEMQLPGMAKLIVATSWFQQQNKHFTFIT